ncbi:DUF6702 family protein [Pollutibacter soli]|uniref:DUF6702 family protein n=1 Tax=Pollutibacter soli TaxID=3034157 RepID=UPI003013AF71
MSKNTVAMVMILCRVMLLLMHPFYVSVTEIEYKSNSTELGVSTKFFTDDLEETLKKFSNSKVDLKNGDVNTNKKWIESYLKKHLQIKINNNTIDFQFLGYEIDQEATWCYYAAEKIPEVKIVDVTADLLYEVKKEQINLFHVIVNGNRKSNRLTAPDNSFRESF